MNAESLPLLGVILIGVSAALAVAALLVSRRRGAAEEAKSDESPAPPSLPEPEPAVEHAPAPQAAGPVGLAEPMERMISVAHLLRDEVTGGLVVRVGQRDYRSAAELLTSRDRQRIEYTLEELNRWFSLAPQKQEERESAKPPAPAAARRPLSMVEQINQILERMLRDLPEAQRAVRLVEGAGGSVRVYVGVNAYSSIDDVPDPDIRGLIREAVAKWEAAQ